MSTPTARLSIFLGAEDRREIDSSQNLWYLDGEEYIVPGGVLETANWFEEADSPYDKAVDSLFPDVSRSLAKHHFLPDAPLELEVSVQKGTAYGMNGLRLSHSSAQRHQEALEDAYQLTQDEHTHLRGIFPANYDPELIGLGVYAEEVADMAAWSEFVDSLNRRGYPNQRWKAGDMVLKRITKIRIGADVRAAESSVGIYHRSRPAMLNPYNDGKPREMGFYPGVDHSPPLEEIAEKLQMFLESSLEQLKADHPENWEEHYGYTDVEIVDERG